MLLNKKLLVSLTLSVLLSITSFAGTSRSLVFRKGGELRILQLTDLHLRPEVPQETARVLSRIDYLVETERPDFIAITGDVLWGKPARGVLRTFLDRMDSYGIPYTFVYGNHDREQDIPLSELSETIAAAKNSINCVDGSGALADLRIPVLSSDGSGKEMADIYMLDSQDYTLIKGAGCYGYFRLDQVAWMRQQCEEATSRNGGVNVPSLAFFHIPLPEFNRVWEIKGRKVIGQRIEESAAPELNTGMFEAMRSTGNVFGVFAGHDHNNDFIANFCTIALGYGRYGGGHTVYNDLRGGGRVIVLYEGENRFRTWIREDDGNVANEASFDRKHISRIDRPVLARAVPEFKDDFVWENSLVCMRAYGKGMESETLSPGFDIWSKVPGRLVSDEWYSHMTKDGGDRIYYHHAPDGKDCYKVGKSLGGGSSMPLIDGKIQYPATNWRECRTIKKKYRETVFELDYPEWEGDHGLKFALTRRISVFANSYFVKVEDRYTVSGGDGPVQLEAAVGIRNADNIKDAPRKGWPHLFDNGRMAFWTAATDQSVEPETAMLGTAVIVGGDCSSPRLTADKKNWIVTQPLKAGDNTITYWTGNTWSRGAIKSSEGWFELVKNMEID